MKDIRFLKLDLQYKAKLITREEYLDQESKLFDEIFAELGLNSADKKKSDE